MVYHLNLGLDQASAGLRNVRNHLEVNPKAQIIVVTHTQPLVTAFRDGSARVLELVKEDGRTLLDGQGILDEPAWHWPSR